MVPSNPVQAMAEGNMLPIIIFSILLGLSMSFAGEHGKRISDFFTDMMEVVMKLVGIVMLIAPYGVFALIAGTAATTGWSTFAGLLKYVVLVMAALIVQAAVAYPLLLKLWSGLSPVRFYHHFRDVIAFAFSTASSGATIPVTLRAVQERMGVSNRISSFTIPLGATINMDGTAIMQGIAVSFIAQYYGVDLSISQYLVVVCVVVLASLGPAGGPGVGLILLAGVLPQVGLPAEGIAMILGVDRLLDMTRTAVNVTGDAVVTCIVANTEGELDRNRFNETAPAQPVSGTDAQRPCHPGCVYLDLLPARTTAAAAPTANSSAPIEQAVITRAIGISVPSASQVDTALMKPAIVNCAAPISAAAVPPSLGKKSSALAILLGAMAPMLPAATTIATAIAITPASAMTSVSMAVTATAWMHSADRRILAE